MCTNGWYLPTHDEWDALYNSVDYDNPKEGFHTSKDWSTVSPDRHHASKFKVAGNYLYVLDAGYDSSLNARGSRGSYWTSTVKDSNQMILFSTSYGKPLYSKPPYPGEPKTSTYSVRLWHDMPK